MWYRRHPDGLFYYRARVHMNGALQWLRSGQTMGFQPYGRFHECNF